MFAGRDPSNHKGVDAVRLTTVRAVDALLGVTAPHVLIMAELIRF